MLLTAATTLAAASAVVVTTAAPALAELPPNEWATLSQKLAGITGDWNNENYPGAISQTMPNTAYLGNGDVGVSSAGSRGVKTFVISKGDFWNGGSSIQTAGLGGVTLQAVAPVETSLNLALNKPVAVSTNSSNASRAVNGEWTPNSGFEGWFSDVGKPQWFRLDLGASTTVGRIVLRHDAAARQGQDANTPKVFSIQYSNDTTAPGTDPNAPGWTTLTSYTNNTASTTDISFTPVSARWVRVYYVQPTQESTSDSTQNPRARLGQIEVYADPNATTPPPAPPFHERQNILDPSIDTDMLMDDAHLTMHTWQGSDSNVVVTELTSHATDPVDLQLSTWSGAGSANGGYTETSGVEGSTLWATRETQNIPTARWVSRATLATRVIGAELQKPAATNTSTSATAKATFRLEPGTTVQIVTGVGGGGRNPTNTLATAQDLITGQTTASLAELAQRKADWWKAYWLQSWVELGDPLLERYYYGAQYEIGSASRPGKLAPALYGIWFTTDQPMFSGDYHLNYNAQAPFYGVYSSNRPELSLPYYQVVEDYVPAAKARAKNDVSRIKPDYVATRPDLAGGADGVLFPVGIGPWGSTSGGQGSSQFPGSYLQQTSNGLFNAMLYVDYWKYTQDKAFLQNEAYPYLKEVAAFFEDWLDDGGVPGGQLNLWAGPHENTWGRNSSPDVPFLRTTLKTLVEASKLLNEDPDQRAVWEDMLNRLAPTPTTTRNGASVYTLADDGTMIGENGQPGPNFRSGDNTVNLEVVQPGDEIDVFSSPADLARGQASVQQMNSWGQLNAFAKVFAQAARVGYDPETLIARLKAQLSGNIGLAPNLAVADGFHGIEKAAATEGINSMLLYGDGEKLAVFPDWPANRDASFHRLLAKGAFEVSAAQTGGVVHSLEITSKAGGDLKLKNPWPTSAVTVTDGKGHFTAVTVHDGFLEFDTKAGNTYYFSTTEPACTSIQTTNRTGPLVVSSGVLCLDGATQTGPVIVRAGAGLRTTAGAKVVGPVDASGAGVVSLCDTEVAGPVNVNGAASVTIGDPARRCAVNTVAGPVSVTNTRGTSVISGNKITGPLNCSGNEPAPVDNGSPNTVTGPKQGQCTNL
ncbi:discoidin domain-containing protein [Planotetraspora thailandica]|uniref:discoidin domain-containing protein n=1 Tax=Planotetraspora thailandica TaxID=487172 RepID=UPI0019525850|nr:discoidin domain-containing protein [Planotetraspora thailandica]